MTTYHRLRCSNCGNDIRPKGLGFEHYSQLVDCDTPDESYVEITVRDTVGTADQLADCREASAIARDVHAFNHPGVVARRAAGVNEHGDHLVALGVNDFNRYGDDQ